MKYKVQITETIQRIVEVDAPSAEDACMAVRQQYRNEEIVLDDGDHKGTDFEVLP